MNKLRTKDWKLLRCLSGFSSLWIPVLLVCVAAQYSVTAQDQSEQSIEGSEAQWHVEGLDRKGDAKFEDFLGRRALWVRNGTQIMRTGVEFIDGTIEFDVAPMLAGNFVGIIFRRESFGNHENVYLRLHRSGLYNAVQYAPRLNFSPTWQLYPEFNAVAEFPRLKWTHVRVEVRATTTEIYVNNQAAPVLVVPRLRGATEKGTVALWGRVNNKPTEWAAAISNISIRPAPASTPTSVATPTPPNGTLVSWEVAGPIKAEAGAVTTLPEMREWKKVGVEESGLVNINRALRGTPGRTVAFARTTVKAEHARRALLELGYSDDVTVFLNGQPVYSGINGFESRHPEYMGFVKAGYENIFLNLRAGDNEIVLAVTEDQRFGWGFVARLKP